MAHPLIQVVDENDQPLLGMSRDQALAEHRYHRIVRILLFDDSGRLLMQKRSANVSTPNVWDCSAAGHVDEGEEYDVAAHREMKEELDVVTDLEEACYYQTNETTEGLAVRRFNKAYKGLINFTPKNFDKLEVADVRWVGLEELEQDYRENPNDYSKGLILVLEKIKK